MKIINNVNFNKKQLKNAVVDNLASAPLNPVKGQIYFDTSLNNFYICTQENPTAVWKKLNDQEYTLTFAAVKNVLAGADSEFSVNNQRITNVATPQNSDEAANKGYVDGAIQGLDIKQSVKAKMVPHPSNFDGIYDSTLSNYDNLTATLTYEFDNIGMQSIFDNVALLVGDRVIVDHENAGKDNGFYEVIEINPYLKMKRVDLLHGQQFGKNINAFAFVEAGDIYRDTGWVIQSPNNSSLIIGTHAMDFVQFSSAGVIEEGYGIDKNGNVISIDKTIVAQKFVGDITGDASTSAFTITHNLNHEWVSVQVIDNSLSGDGERVFVDVKADNTSTSNKKNKVIVDFGSAPSVGENYKVIVIG